MDPQKELDDLQSKAAAVIAGAKASGRELTDDEMADLEKGRDRAVELKAAIERGKKSAALMAELGGAAKAATDDATPDAPEAKAATLGEHFVKSGALAKFNDGIGQRTASAPEYKGEVKAATDTNLVAGNGKVQYGGVVETPLRRLTVADLLAKGTMTNTSLTYWVQGTFEGAPAAVAEDGQKPQVHFNFSPVTEALAKIAVITKVSDEAISDVPYIVSIINSQLVGRLQVVEEDQLLNGSGTAPNLRGILNRSGLQTYATVTPYTAAKGFDGIFHAITMVATGAAQGNADGIVINPADYETLRLAKDAENRYYAGGPFTGGNPGLWGVRTVVTPAIAAGTVLVGDFSLAAQMFRKGGIQVDSTNSDSTDFQFNRVALRAEERILLAVYVPTAFVKLTLTA